LFFHAGLPAEGFFLTAFSAAFFPIPGGGIWAIKPAGDAVFNVSRA